LKLFPILAYVAPIKVRNRLLGFELRVSTEPGFKQNRIFPSTSRKNTKKISRENTVIK
jgi:hypothetical protein